MSRFISPPTSAVFSDTGQFTNPANFEARGILVT